MRDFSHRNMPSALVAVSLARGPRYTDIQIYRYLKGENQKCQESLWISAADCFVARFPSYMNTLRVRIRVMSVMMGAMRIVIHKHAFKHGLTEEQIMAAYESGGDAAFVRKRDEGADPPRWAVIGFDHQARQIELLVVKALDGCAVIIHANWLTKGFLNEVRRSRR